MRTLIVMFGIIALITGSAGAFAQAAAEAALAHSMSSATGTAMGNALGRATNQMAGRLGQQTTQTVQPRTPTVKPGLQPQARVSRANGAPNTSSPNHGSSSNGSMIASIQGGKLQELRTGCTRAATSQTEAQMGNGAASVSPATANGAPSAKKTGNDCSQPAATSQDGNTYQSVITLPAAQ